MEREIICVSCPVGCTMTVSGSAEDPAVSGNQCRAGINYAKKELINPTRNIATSIRVAVGSNQTQMLSVKTASPIPKEAIMRVVKEIHKTEAVAPVEVGDVILENAAETGVNIVATRKIIL